MLKRREVLQLAASGAASLAALSPFSPARAQEPVEPAAPPAKAPPQPEPSIPFSGNLVVELARALAAKPFVAPPSDLPSAISGLNFETYVAIRARPEALLWAGDSSGFVIEPLHRGFVFSTPMQINFVENGLAQRLVYDQSKFDFGGLKLNAPLTNLDFSGFRISQPGENGTLREMAIFQGASFFRSLAQSQALGVMARGLSIRTADARGEEFPFFRAVWIEKPTRAANALTIHALLDSESVAGAYRFTLHPGDATIIDTECSLFPRAAVDHFGIGTMSATSLFGPIDRRSIDDTRATVAETLGLQMLTGRDEWLWRPASNRTSLQIAQFMDEKPKGFGFLQRNRNFNYYQDDNQHWERRPSLWIEPIGEWAKGSVELVEIPSDSEIAQNMIAYWRPDAPLVKGQQTDFAYRQFWCWDPPSSPPPLAFVQDTRGGHGPNGKQRRFVVDFQGDIFADAGRTPQVSPNLTISSGKIAASRVFLSRERKSCRIQFDIDPANEPACEMRLTLESQGATISETWLYRWTP